MFGKMKSKRMSGWTGVNLGFRPEMIWQTLLYELFRKEHISNTLEFPEITAHMWCILFELIAVQKKPKENNNIMKSRGRCIYNMLQYEK